MFGTFQQSHLRIEVEATATAIQHSLLYPRQLQQWYGLLDASASLPEQLETGMTFTSSLGPVSVHHRVDLAQPTCLRLLLSRAVDGVHEWYWGDGWVQSCIEGITLLPVKLGQTVLLLRLKQFLSEYKTSEYKTSEYKTSDIP